MHILTMGPWGKLLSSLSLGYLIRKMESQSSVYAHSILKVLSKLKRSEQISVHESFKRLSDVCALADNAVHTGVPQPSVLRYSPTGQQHRQGCGPGSGHRHSRVRFQRYHVLAERLWARDFITMIPNFPVYSQEGG